MFCTKCGKQNQDDAVFCSSCGMKMGTQDLSQEQQGNNEVFTPVPSFSLNSMPPATINPGSIAMFKVKNMGIAMEMDDIWGEKVFCYLNQQEMHNDLNNLFTVLQQITKNMVMQFKSEGGPVVPIYRINNVNVSDWWGPSRIEMDIEGAGRQWFPYSDKSTRDADHIALMNLMRKRQQQ